MMPRLASCGSASASPMVRTRAAGTWRACRNASHSSAVRVRTMGEALADPQLASRGIIHHHATATGIEGGFGVPLAAFTFAHGGPRIDSTPPTLGQHNEEIFGELGVTRA